MSDQDLSRQEELLFLSEFSNELIARHGCDGKFLSVSPAASRIVGYSAEELIGKEIFSFVHPEDERPYRDLVRCFSQPLSQIMIRYRFRKKCGAYIWFETVLHFRNGALFSVSSDISKRVAAMEALQETESSFTAFFNGSACPLGIVEIDGDDLIHVATNTASEKFFGVPTQVMLGRLKPSPLFSEQAIQALIANYRRSEETSQPITIEFMLPRPHDPRWLAVTVNYIGLNPAGVKRYSYYILDVTERKHAQMHSTQVSKMASLGEMAAGISHEINNPLTVIKANAYHIRHRLQQGRLDHGLLARAISAIDQTTDRIAQIIRGLRVFARESSGDPFLEASISSIVEDTLSLCQARIKNAGIRITIDNRLSSLKIACRAAEVSQILVNLLNNAVDAVLGSANPWIRIEVYAFDDRIELAVSDSGLGVAFEIRDKIMQPFFTTKEVGKGIGLGLSISQGLAELHEGRLYLDTQSRNTRFVLELPKFATTNRGPTEPTVPHAPMPSTEMQTLY